MALVGEEVVVQYKELVNPLQHRASQNASLAQIVPGKRREIEPDNLSSGTLVRVHIETRPRQ